MTEVIDYALLTRWYWRATLVEVVAVLDREEVQCQRGMLVF
jgi:hypothetical protein